MEKQYQIHCECDAIQAVLSGVPLVRGYCHCEDCRDLLNVPYYSVTAWNADQLEIIKGTSSLVEYQHPRLAMKRVYCGSCGEMLYNTNAMSWCVVPQLLIRKCNDGVLPDELSSQSHFFYARRIINIDDSLPKND